MKKVVLLLLGEWLLLTGLRAQAFEGTWTGAFKILGIQTPISLELTTQGNALRGVLKDEQNSYRLEGTIAGNRSQGKVITAVGIRYNYLMDLAGDQLSFSYKAGFMGTFRSEMTRTGGGNYPDQAPPMPAGATPPPVAYPSHQAPTTAPLPPARQASAEATPVPSRPAAGPASSPAGFATASRGKLYLRTTFWASTGTLEISILYLGNDGVVVLNPALGADPVNPAAEAAARPSEVGRYRLTGNQAQVTWQDGRQQTLSIERDSQGELSAWDGGLTSLCQKFGANTRLDKCYTGTATAGRGSVSNTSTYRFQANGTFELNSLGTISTGIAGQASEGQYRGTYTLGGNTLRLSFADGRKENIVITPFTDYNRREGFIMNGRQFKLCL
ncbi:MAG: hypothetical protein KKG00_09555 [Bacteroidetes bacterium]|nr:hypothetical protein [Bacteroidota bacterium]